MENLYTNIHQENDLLKWKLVIKGDNEAFSSIFEKYYSILVNYSRTFSKTEDEAKDFVQDVFLEIWKYKSNLNPNVIVKAYLLASVRKRIARFYGRDNVFKNIQSDSSIDFLFDFSIEDHIIADEIQEERIKTLNGLINQLSNRQKEAIYLRFHLDLSVNQVAEMLELNYQSAKNLIHRSLVVLRKEWATLLLLFFLRVQ